MEVWVPKRHVPKILDAAIRQKYSIFIIFNSKIKNTYKFNANNNCSYTLGMIIYIIDGKDKYKNKI